MQYRRKLTRRGSKSLFKATALKTHVKNAIPLSRGGIRL